MNRSPLWALLMGLSLAGACRHAPPPDSPQAKAQAEDARAQGERDDAANREVWQSVREWMAAEKAERRRELQPLRESLDDFGKALDEFERHAGGNEETVGLKLERLREQMRRFDAEHRGKLRLVGNLRVVSDDIWRGYNRAPNAPSYQPAVSLDTGRFSTEVAGASFWERGPRSKFMEWHTRWLMELYRTERARVHLRYQYFAFPEPPSVGFRGVRKTQDLGLVLGRRYAPSADLALEPEVEILRDWDRGTGNLGRTGVAVERTATGRLQGLRLALSAYYNHALFRRDSSFSHAEARVELPLWRDVLGLDFRPFLAYQQALDHQDFDDELFGGANISFSY